MINKQTLIIESMLIISLILLTMYPSVSAQTTYLSVDYDDLTYGTWSRSDLSKFTYANNGNGYCGYCSFSSANAYVYTSIKPGNNYEVFFDFKYSSITNRFDIFRMNGAHASTTYSVAVWILSNNSLYIDGVYSGVTITPNVWHKMFLNVTNKNTVRYSLDGSKLSGPYTSTYVTQGIAEYGTIVSTSGGTFWFDNWTIASKVGTRPVASFTVYPGLTGDGLTNFVFTDTSLPGTYFGYNLYWDFGDGNYTYGILGQSVNHTYIHPGTYTIVLNCSNLLGYDLAYTNITVSDISIGGSEFMSDTMFGFALVVGLITVMNYIGIKLRFLMVSLFAFLSMFFAIALLWQNDNVYITLMICMVLSNIALLVYGFTKD